MENTNPESKHAAPRRAVLALMRHLTWVFVSAASHLANANQLTEIAEAARRTRQHELLRLGVETAARKSGRFVQITSAASASASASAAAAAWA